MTFSRRRPVFVGEDDASGLIYFPSYAHYVSEGDQLVLEEIGLPVARQIADRLAMPVVRLELDLRAPVRAGDVLTQSVTLAAGRRSTITSDHVFELADGAVAATGRLTRVYTDLDSMRSVPLPSALRELMTGVRVS